MSVAEVVESARAAAVVATGTMATGVAKALQWIPEDVGKLGTCAGLVLSIVLVWVHISKELRDRRRFRWEQEARDDDA